MKFQKMHGTGNDFIVLEPDNPEADWSALAKKLCDRHFGIGADGILLVLPSQSADFRMRDFNPDGSEAEMCGNGIRCITKHIIDSGLAHKSTKQLRIETLAGVITVRPSLTNGVVSHVQVDMGVPIFNPAKIPVDISQLKAQGDPRSLPMVRDYPLSVADRVLPITCVSMGNPHAILFTQEPVDAFPLEEIGRRVEHHPLFPRRVNFEVVNIVDRGHVRVHVWERGAGATLACGTGACAVVAAGVTKGVLDNEVDITLPGGTLHIQWEGSDSPVLMTGPVELVFMGEVPNQKSS